MFSYYWQRFFSFFLVYFFQLFSLFLHVKIPASFDFGELIIENRCSVVPLRTLPTVPGCGGKDARSRLSILITSAL